MIQEQAGPPQEEDRYNPGIAGLLPQTAKPSSTIPQNNQLEQYHQYLNMVPFLKSMSNIAPSQNPFVQNPITGYTTGIDQQGNPIAVPVGGPRPVHPL